ncbi:MAG: metal ABC transporter permease [Acidobacteriota bacterium]
MSEIIGLLAAPFAICLILAGIHCYLGLHVVSRGVIFVDLSLAQVAALGATTALLGGYDLQSQEAYLTSLFFTFIGAAIFALSRMREERIPQEAIIGVVYAVGSSAAILILDRAPHGHEAIKSMLVGSVLYVTWNDVWVTLTIYLAIGIIHYLLRRKFMLISMNLQEARRLGLFIRFWDFLFYVTFGIVVTSSVKIAGVLLVFSYLVIPSVCAMLFTNSIGKRLAIGWTIGFLVSILGLYFSALFDLPTGSTVVTTFGAVLILSGLARLAILRAGWLKA